MEDNGGDKVNVLKYTQTFLPADVPQSHGLVHAAGQDEEVLGPGHVQEVARVAGVGHEGPLHEDVSGTLRVRQIVLDGVVLVSQLSRDWKSLCLHLVSSPHVVEVLIFVAQDPDTEDAVLTSRGQQSPTQRELHAPDRTLVVAGEVLAKLNTLEISRT